MRYEHSQDNLSRKKWIEKEISEGREVVIATHMRAWRIKKETLEKWEKYGGLLKDIENNVIGTETYIKIGKNWDCINYCSIVSY